MKLSIAECRVLHGVLVFYSWSELGAPRVGWEENPGALIGHKVTVRCLWCSHEKSDLDLQMYHGRHFQQRWEIFVLLHTVLVRVYPVCSSSPPPVQRR